MITQAVPAFLLIFNFSSRNFTIGLAIRAIIQATTKGIKNESILGSTVISKTMPISASTIFVNAFQ